MPQVDFYVLDREDPLSRLQFTCRLVGKILALQQSVGILVNDQATADQLDTLLWHYPPESFSPHALEADTSETSTSDSLDGTASPVLISLNRGLPSIYPICINLQTETPTNHSALQRLVEIVCQDANILNTTREKYKFYRQQDYPLQSHPIPSSAL